MSASKPHSEEALQLARALIIEIPEEDLAKSGLLLLSQEVIRLHEQLETSQRLARWAFDYIGIDWEQSYDDEPPAVTEARALLTTGKAQTTAAVAGSESTPASRDDA